MRMFPASVRALVAPLFLLFALSACTPDASLVGPASSDEPAFAVAAAPAGLSFSSQGNSDAAKACQKDGYKNWRRQDGSSFKNAGECTSYVARGGTLKSPGAPPRIYSLSVHYPDRFTVAVTAVFDGVHAEINGYVISSGETITIPRTTVYQLEVTGSDGTVAILSEKDNPDAGIGVPME